MARSQGIQVENNFTKGLITESTALNFPENACTETYNCVFDETGRITRRGGLDIETEYVLGATRTVTDGEAHSEFTWSNVAGLGTKSFFVEQQGNNLVFFNVSETSTVTKNGEHTVIDLTTYAVSGHPLQPLEYSCQFAEGAGSLIVVNSGIEPLRISYNLDTDTISAEAVTLKYRDFTGLEYVDSLFDSITYRPSYGSINTMKTTTPDGTYHFYNLLNQGWWQGGISGGNPDSTSALGQWDTARADMPSNADRVSYYRASNTDSFDNARVGSYDQGNTPAAKGHFLLSVGNASRKTALENAGYTISFSSTADSTVSYSTGSLISGNGASTTNSGLSAAFNGSTASSGYFQGPTVSDTSLPLSVTSSGSGYVGKDFTTGKRVVSVSVNFSIKPAAGYDVSVTTESAVTLTYSRSATLYLYASNTLPTSQTDGTLLGSRSVSSTTSGTYSSTANISSSDTTTAYRYIWVRVAFSTSLSVSGSGLTSGSITAYKSQFYPNEITFTERITTSGTGQLPDTDFTTYRPACTTFFAGRAWYGGIEYENLSNNIYFSQIVEQPSQFGSCYQANDPTSEEFFDILDTDGGIIRIPEMGRLIKLDTYQNVLFAFATNGTWLIKGGSGGFSPTNFVVRKIDSRGTHSPMSFINVNGLPMWWGEDAILQMEYNPQFDSFSVADVTEETIRSFYTDIPAANKRYAKGAYDLRNGIAYWACSSTEDERYRYNSVLCLNTLSGAFYPWTFTESTPIIKGLAYVYDSIGTSTPTIKFMCIHPVTSTTGKLFAADLVSNTTYTDWANYADLVSLVSTDEKDYTSYFITGYKLHAEAMKFFQANYIMVFLETETNSGAYIQGVFDFTNTGDSGKWSQQQEIYNSALLNRDVNYRRLKIRGKGRSLQFKVTSQSGKPFTIIGWAGWETANTEL